MTASYYFWKWADNDVPGQPAEVHSALLRGELHPALQVFDARPLLAQLQECSQEGCNQGEEWSYYVHPVSTPATARFVFVICPRANSSESRVRAFYKRFVPLGLSGIDEQEGHLIPCLRPKLNCFITGQFPYEPFHDITAGDLPFLLRRILPGRPEPWGELWNRRNDAVVAVAHGRRFRVEWRDVFDETVPGRFRQWRARDPKRLAALNGQDDTQALPAGIDPDYISYADALRIFQTFLHGDTRPPKYLWRELKRPESL